MTELHGCKSRLIKRETSGKIQHWEKLHSTFAIVEDNLVIRCSELDEMHLHERKIKTSNTDR